MKKLYYKIKLRIAKIIQEAKDDTLGEMLYYSDGYIILENNKFEGFVTRDYLCGEYAKNELFIKMLYSHQILSSDSPYDPPYLEAETVKYLSFSADLDEFYIPDEYTLEILENDNLIAEISFIEIEKNPKAVKKIEMQLMDAKKFHHI